MSLPLSIRSANNLAIEWNSAAERYTAEELQIHASRISLGLYSSVTCSCQ